MSENLIVENGAAPTAAPPKRSDIQVSIKRNVHHIEIDMDKLTWKDAKQLNKYRAAIAAGSMTEDETVAVIDEIIEKVAGRHPDDMPVEVVNKIVEVLFAEDADALATEGN